MRGRGAVVQYTATMVRRTGMWLTLGVSSVVLACGASSKTAGDDDDGAETGGATTGGTSGTEGGSAGAEKGGTSGSETGGALATGGQPTLGGSGGTGGGIDEPPPDRDDDGISDEDESTSGTNPDAKDSDGDGCDDLLEASFGECDAGTMESVSCEGNGALVLTMAAGTGSLMSDLTTEFAPPGDLWPKVEAITPEGAADVDDLLQLESVEPAATLTVRVVPFVVARWSGVRKYAFYITSAEGGVLAEGKILWRRQNCPLPPG